MLLRKYLHSKIAATFYTITTLLLLPLDNRTVSYLLMHQFIVVSIDILRIPGGSIVTDAAFGVVKVHSHVLVTVLLLLS